MNLDQVTIEIRPRQAWEAVDLGILMAKRWWLPMMKVWLLISLPFFCLSLLIPTKQLWLSITLIWWLKPLFERPLLHMLSRAVFNDLPSVRDTVKTFPALAFKQMFASLTWRRFSPSRSMDLPVLQLEGLNGDRRQERLRVLHREDAGAASWLTFIGANLESFLGLSIMGFIWSMIPTEIDIDWANLFFDRDAAQLQYAKAIIWYLSMSLVAPFYVACGFSLYLNRRIKLEAWDIDIAFRRIVSKRTQPTTSAPHTSSIKTIALAIITCITLLVTDGYNSAYAEDRLPETTESASTSNNATLTATEMPAQDYTPIDRSTAKKTINSLMKQEEFSRKETERHLKFSEPKEDADEEHPFIDWLENLFKSADAVTGIAGGLEYVLWALVIALIFVVAFRYRHWLAAQFVRVNQPRTTKEKPVTLFGMAITRESLPADISTAASQLLQDGDVRAAIALLYRACLYRLIYIGVDIQDGNTENECVLLMREHFSAKIHTEQQIDYFSQLTLVWQRLAYGHLLPDHVMAQQLCSSWNDCWLQQPATTRGAQ